MHQQDQMMMKRSLKEQIEEAGEVWKETLEHFQQPRALLEMEMLAIGRAIQQYGLEPVKMAFIGSRREPKTATFNPADWVSLDRVLMAKNFKRFLGLGARQRLVSPGRPAVDWGPLGPPPEDEGEES